MSAVVLWAGAPASAQVTELVVGLGQTTGVISGVRNVPGTAPIASNGQTKTLGGLTFGKEGA
ncbi:hypothetical protein [Actinomyces trachealis]|uniref:hypothetical protein n=1 Tax=Actinomyces trachealis TaxID=2763540 RepID=UPI001892C947|nr:hypothetical protein [Actinomyces trachealis]